MMSGKRSHGEGSIRQVKNGKWHGQLMDGYHENGKRKLYPLQRTLNQKFCGLLMNTSLIRKRKRQSKTYQHFQHGPINGIKIIKRRLQLQPIQGINTHLNYLNRHLVTA